MPRGPYKQYEHNPSVIVPRTTDFNRRKRRIIQIQNENENNIEFEDEIQMEHHHYDIENVINIESLQGNTGDIQVRINNQ